MDDEMAAMVEDAAAIREDWRPGGSDERSDVTVASVEGFELVTDTTLPGAEVEETLPGTEIEEALVGTETEAALVGTETEAALVGAETEEALVGAETEAGLLTVLTPLLADADADILDDPVAPFMIFRSGATLMLALVTTPFPSVVMVTG
jgi:hypothetical protein